MERIYKNRVLIRLAAVLTAAIVYLALRLPSPHEGAAAKDELYYVARVIDGDTLKLSDNNKVRLIGVDCPESFYNKKLLRDSKRSHKDTGTIQKLGMKAKDFTKKLCQGKKVRLEFDVERHDRYGRTLAYVYLEDGTFVNAKILEEGYGQVMTIPPDVKYADYFLKSEKEARSNNRGLWALD